MRLFQPVIAKIVAAVVTFNKKVNFSGGVQIGGVNKTLLTTDYFVDNIKLYFGSSQDAWIFHTGAYIVLSNDTGSIIFVTTAAEAIYFKTDDTDRWTISASGHFVPLVDNAYNMGNTTTGIKNIYQGNTGYHYFGDSQDAYAIHNGSHFFIRCGTGNIDIGTTAASVVTFKTNDAYRWAINSDGHFVPQSDNAFDIGNNGTGHVRHIYQGDNGYHYFGDDQDAYIRHNGSDVLVRNGSGTIDLGTTTASVINFKTNDSYRWTITSDGHFTPDSANTYDIGSTSKEVRHIYQGDDGYHYFGTDQDSYIYFDGDDLHIGNDTGDIVFDDPVSFADTVSRDGNEQPKFKTVQIGIWDMDTDSVKDVAHGLTFSDIISVTGVIYNDVFTLSYPIGCVSTSNQYPDSVVGQINSTNIRLGRLTGGLFDSISFSDDLMNRGYLHIVYK